MQPATAKDNPHDVFIVMNGVGHPPCLAGSQKRLRTHLLNTHLSYWRQRINNEPAENDFLLEGYTYERRG